ncbi:MAG: methyltransferase domain-containing protein [Thomasclavelia spiroformis]
MSVFKAKVINIDSDNVDVRELDRCDCVISVNYLHKVKSVKDVLANIKRILKDTGCLVALKLPNRL